MPPSVATIQYPAAVVGSGHAHDRLVERCPAHRTEEPGVPEGVDAPGGPGHPVAAAVRGPGHGHGRATERGGRGEPVRLEPQCGGEGVAGQRDVLIGAHQRHRRDPPTPVPVTVAPGDADRLQHPQLWPGGVDGRYRFGGGPIMVGVTGSRHAHRVSDIGYPGKGSGVRVAAGGGRVLGGGDGPVGELHDLSQRVGHGLVGDGAVVQGAPVGLTGQVTRVGVAPVGARAGHDVGADGHRLGLEFLKAPGLTLRSGSTQCSPSGR